MIKMEQPASEGAHLRQNIQELTQALTGEDTRPVFLQPVGPEHNRSKAAYRKLSGITYNGITKNIFVPIDSFSQPFISPMIEGRISGSLNLLNKSTDSSLLTLSQSQNTATFEIDQDNTNANNTNSQSAQLAITTRTCELDSNQFVPFQLESTTAMRTAASVTTVPSVQSDEIRAPQDDTEVIQNRCEASPSAGQNLPFELAKQDCYTYIPIKPFAFVSDGVPLNMSSHGGKPPTIEEHIDNPCMPAFTITTSLKNHNYQNLETRNPRNVNSMKHQADTVIDTQQHYHRPQMSVATKSVPCCKTSKVNTSSNYIPSSDHLSYNTIQDSCREQQEENTLNLKIDSVFSLADYDSGLEPSFDNTFTCNQPFTNTPTRIGGRQENNLPCNQPKHTPTSTVSRQGNKLPCNQPSKNTPTKTGGRQEINLTCNEPSKNTPTRTVSRQGNNFTSNQPSKNTPTRTGGRQEIDLTCNEPSKNTPTRTGGRQENELTCYEASKNTPTKTGGRQENELTCYEPSKNMPTSTVSRQENKLTCNQPSKNTPTRTVSRQENNLTCNEPFKNTPTRTGGRQENNLTCYEPSKNTPTRTVSRQENILTCNQPKNTPTRTVSRQENNHTYNQPKNTPTRTVSRQENNHTYNQPKHTPTITVSRQENNLTCNQPSKNTPTRTGCRQEINLTCNEPSQNTPTRTGGLQEYNLTCNQPSKNTPTRTGGRQEINLTCNQSSKNTSTRTVGRQENKGSSIPLQSQHRLSSHVEEGNGKNEETRIRSLNSSALYKTMQLCENKLQEQEFQSQHQGNLAYGKPPRLLPKPKHICPANSTRDTPKSYHIQQSEASLTTQPHESGNPTCTEQRYPTTTYNTLLKMMDESRAKSSNSVHPQPHHVGTTDHTQDSVVILEQSQQEIASQKHANRIQTGAHAISSSKTTKRSENVTSQKCDSMESNNPSEASGVRCGGEHNPTPNEQPSPQWTVLNEMTTQNQVEHEKPDTKRPSALKMILKRKRSETDNNEPCLKYAKTRLTDGTTSNIRVSNNDPRVKRISANHPLSTDIQINPVYKNGNLDFILIRTAAGIFRVPLNPSPAKAACAPKAASFDISDLHRDVQVAIPANPTDQVPSFQKQQIVEIAPENSPAGPNADKILLLKRQLLKKQMAVDRMRRKLAKAKSIITEIESD